MAILIQQEARSMRRGGKGGVDIKALLARCSANGVKDRLRTAFNQYKQVPETPPVMAAPPPTNELYGRFANKTAIIDIGTGNSLKIKKFTGVLRVTAVDPNLTADEGTVLKKLKMTAEEFLRLHRPEDPLITSFMSMCQIRSECQIDIFKFDGLHMLPDHDHLLAIGAAKVDGDKINVDTGRGVYADFPVPAGGYNLAAGYNLLPVFAKREISVTLSSEVSVITDFAVIDARPAGFHDLDLSDMGWKWDGTARELELYNGQAYLLDRAGRQQVGVSDFSGHICLHLEELAECFVLLRVVAHRGMIPPHCGFTLRTYAERVRLKINNKPVCGPPLWRAGRQPKLVWYDDDGRAIEYTADTDGVISRINGNDYYCKYQWTVDLRDTTFPRLYKKLEDLAMEGECEVKAGLWEYGVDRRDHKVTFTALRARHDKRKETTLDTVLFMLNKPTLSEKDVLTL